VGSLMARSSEPVPTLLCRKVEPLHCGQESHDFEIDESGWLSATRNMAFVDGTDRTLLPHIGNKARLLTGKPLSSTPVE